MLLSSHLFHLLLLLLVPCVHLTSSSSGEHHSAHTQPASNAEASSGGHGEAGRDDKSLPPVPGQPKHKAEDNQALGHYSPLHETELHEYHVFHVEFDRVEIPFIIALWIFVASLAKIGFHMTPKLHHIFPESCLLIVVGIIIGFLLFLTSEHPPSTLTPDVFFLFMLPPIILDAGYFMPNRLFFDHLGTILLMAVVGTIFNVLTIGVALWGVGQTGLYGTHDTPGILETFLFSSLISAVDPVAVLAVFEEIQVDEVLYIVVFGESLLNDAVTVVLYHMFEAYVEIEEANIVATDIAKGFASFLVVAGGGTIIGIIWGYVTGFVTRFTHHAQVLEPLFVFTMAYLSYLTAEIFHMSGILAITFCGITMKNYVERNVSQKSQTTIKYAIKMLSSSSETIIFMFLGVATIHDEHDWNWCFVVLTIFFCTIFRCIGVLILTAMANRYRLQKLGMVDQFVMMYGGLRGAVAFALVLLIDPHVVPHAHMFTTTTIAMIYWTVFVQGITIKPLVKFLNVKTSSGKDPTMNERITGRFMDHIISGMEGVLGEFGNLKIREIYRQIDSKYIKPCLLRDKQVKDPKIIETYEAITNNEVVEYMKKNPSTFHIKNMDSLSQKSSSSMNPILQENRDLKEINFNQSRKDLTEARIHHLLSESLTKPQNRTKKLSYSRHELSDQDYKTGFREHAQVRRMMSEKRTKKKNIKRIKSIDSDQPVEEEEMFRVTGSQKQLLDDKLHQLMAEEEERSEPPSYDDIQDCLSFRAASPLGNQTGVKSKAGQLQKKVSEIQLLLSHGTTMPDNHKPEWMHNTSKKYSKYNPGFENPAFELHETDGGGLERPGSLLETVLPWKREESPGLVPLVMSEREFPLWLRNEDYLTIHSSPAHSLAGERSRIRPSLLDVFMENNTPEEEAYSDNDDNSGRKITRVFNDLEFLALMDDRRQRRVSLPGITCMESLPIISRDRPSSILLQKQRESVVSFNPTLNRMKRQSESGSQHLDAVCSFENEIKPKTQ